MFDAISLWRWLLLAFFFAALGALWWWSKAGELKELMSGKRKEPRLKVVERRYLSPKASVFLVEVDGQSYLLAQSGTSAAWQPLPQPPHAAPGLSGGAS
jgi:hypothetical protein